MKEAAKGSIQEMLLVVLPMIVSQACDTIMIFIDRLFLARVSPELMNAAMGGGLTSFMTMTFFLGLMGYTTALVAQYLGAEKKAACSRVVTQSMVIGLCAYPLILLCKPFTHYLFTFMGVPSEQVGPQRVYCDLLLGASWITLLRSGLFGFFSGIGTTSIIMMATVCSLVVNVLLNYVLIYGKWGFPALGITGAAYGTIAGNACGFIILLCAYLRKKVRTEFSFSTSLRFDQRILMQFLRFGSPAGVEMFLNLLAFTTMVMTFHGHGMVTATAATVLFNWDLVSFVPLIGIEIGVMSLVGRYMGARDSETAHRSAYAGLMMGLLYSAVIMCLFVGIPDYLVRLFEPQGSNETFTQAIPLARFMIRAAALYVLVDAMIVAFIGALRGAGDTVWAMILTVGLHWLSAGAAFLLMRVYHVSPEMTWFAVVCIFLVSSGVIYLRFKSGRWKKISVVSNESYVIPHEV